MSFTLSVKEMSQITNVSKRNIRYYDSVGLFKPSGISDNGYRYYDIEKIEELRLINYLRHAGVSIKEIEKHLKNRNIDEYVDILNNQLVEIESELNKINALKIRLKNKLTSIEYIRSLKHFDEIRVKVFPKRRILKKMVELRTPIDWERAMLTLEEELPPSLVVGDNGFFVDLNRYKERKGTEFSGLFMIADDPFTLQSSYLEYLEEGSYLTLYLKGNHDDAQLKYKELIEYAETNKLVLEPYALERTLIDHFISSDKELYITEIQIPIREKEAL